LIDLLEALAFPPGSEILVSAITIRDMTRIIEHHRLVPVPIDLHMQTLSLTTECLERAVSPRTRAIVVAHLFGSRMPLDNVVVFARQHGLYVIEDCAQAYVGNGYRGHPDSDICMFSFGPIKTNTALGGGVLRIKDRSLLSRVRILQSRYPVQSRWYFLRRLCKYAALKLLTFPLIFGIFVAVCQCLGRSHDQIISSAVRGFPGPGFFTKIRQQPCSPLLALLERRLKNFDQSRIERRMAVASAAIKFMPHIERPGAKAPRHTYWVFPIQTATPDKLMQFLWRMGFDATRGASSLYVVEPPIDRPKLMSNGAPRQVIQNVLYLPVYPGITANDLQRLACAITDFQADTDSFIKG
jgi:perosamine synthetase